MNRILFVCLAASFFLMPSYNAAFSREECYDCWVSEALNDNTGVYCEINTISLFTKSFKDCTDAGGIVTHSETPDVTIKLGENIPSQYVAPAIQDSSD